MSYQVLARKWRPKGFAEVVGQDHVVRALSNALQQNRLHHAYLFTGTRGVGKTTLARILAKCLNCETGITAEPCEVCETCVSVNEGRFVDLIEVDGASRTKVEDTRELLDNVQYAPVQGRTKIYLIDEVHMLSTHSFNALLKTLEEPPPYVKFLLATTDPQKVPVTILSRCLQFTLKQLTPECIVAHLKNILNAEHIPFDEPALLMLGRAARGSARDALSLADQAIAYGAGEVRQEHVHAMLGTVHQHALSHLLEALVTQEVTKVLGVVESLSSDGVDLQQLMQDLLSALHRMTLAKTVPSVLNLHDPLDQGWMGLAEHFSVEVLQVYYQIVLLGLRDLHWAPHVREGVEMLLLRMMLFDVADPTGNGSAGNGSIENTSNGNGSVENDFVGNGNTLGDDVVVDAPPTNISPINTSPANTSPTSTSPSDIFPASTIVPPNCEVSSYNEPLPPEAAPCVGSVRDLETESLSEPVLEESKPELVPESPVAVQTKATVHTEMNKAVGEDVPSDLQAWLALIQSMSTGQNGLLGPALNVARNCVWAVSAEQAEVCQLQIDPGLKMLLSENAQQRLTDALLQTGFKRVTFSVVAHGRMTPSQWMERCQREAQQRALTEMQENAFVRALQERFGATLRVDTVKPTLGVASSNEAEPNVSLP